MNVPRRSSLLWFIGIFLASSIALGYDYLFIYDPPIRTVEKFEAAMAWGDVAAVKSVVVVGNSLNLEELHEPTDEEIRQLLMEPFDKGRVIDLRERIDDKATYHYVVYRGADSQVYAYIVTKFGGKLRIIVSDRRTGAPTRYLWEYTWNN